MNSICNNKTISKCENRLFPGRPIKYFVFHTSLVQRNSETSFFQHTFHSPRPTRFVRRSLSPLAATVVITTQEPGRRFPQCDAPRVINKYKLELTHECRIWNIIYYFIWLLNPFIAGFALPVYRDNWPLSHIQSKESIFLPRKRHLKEIKTV